MGEELELSDGEAALYCKLQPYNHDMLKLDEFGTFSITKRLERFELIGNDVADVMPSVYLLCPQIPR